MPLFPEDTAPTAPRQQQRGQQAADPGEHAALRHLPAPAAEPLAHHHERRALLRGDRGTPIVSIAGCWRWRAKSQLVAVRSKQRQAASARPVLCLQQAQDAASFRDVRAGLAAGRLAPGVPDPVQPSRRDCSPNHLQRGFSFGKWATARACVRRVAQTGVSTLFSGYRFKQTKKPKQPYLGKKQPSEKGPRSKLARVAGCRSVRERFG